MYAESRILFRALAPEPVMRLVEQVEAAWSTGLLSDPFWLARQWRHRRPFLRLQKALLYHRWVTGLLLGHEIGVFKTLEKGPRDLAGLARACHVHPRAADQLLRILVAEGLVKRHDGKFALTTFAKNYVAETGRFSVAPMLSLMAAQASAFHQLPSSMGSGEVPDALNIFDEDGRYKAFLGAVNEFLNWAGRDLLLKVKLPEVKDFIVGSMGVSFSAAVLEKFPQAHVTYGCLEHLVREIPRLRKQYNVPRSQVTGMHSHGGDPAADRWGDESYDLVFLTKKMILAPEERMGEKFAAKAFEVLRPGGVAIFWETIHPEGDTTPLAHAMEAVLDLGASPTGLVNTDTGITRVLEDIGYAKVEIVNVLGGLTTFVVARKGA